MDKRDQINFVLEPSVRQALDELRDLMSPKPTVKALLSHLIVKERDDQMSAQARKRKS